MAINRNLRAFARERLTISTTALPLTASVYESNSLAGDVNRKRAQAATIRVVSGGDIWRTTNGETPSATVGVTNVPGADIELDSYQAIKGARFLRTAGSDSVLEVTYYA